MSDTEGLCKELRGLAYETDWTWVSAKPLYQRAAAEIERLRGVETGYLARGLTIDRLIEQNYKLSRELAEARDENDRLRSGLETLRAAFIIAVGDRSPFAKAALDAADSAMERKP